MSDLFEADHIEAASALDEAYDAGKSFQARLDAEADPSPALIADIAAWEERTGTRSRRPRIGRRAVVSPSDRHQPVAEPDGTAGAAPEQLLLVELWVGDERKRAGEQAKDRYR